MASTRYISIIDENCATEDEIWFSFDVGVTDQNSGNYYVRYQVGSKSKVTTDTFYMAAGEETTIGPYYQSGLSADTTYTVNASLVVAANNTVVATDQIRITTAEPAFKPPTISISSVSATSSKVTVNCYVYVPSGGTHYVVFKASYLGMSQSHTSYSFTSSRSLSWTFDGIPDSTSVSLRVEVRDYSTDELYDYDTDSISTDAPQRPSNWSWSSTVSKGSAMPYTRSGDVVTCKPLTAAEWNGFIDRIGEFLYYLGMSVTNMSSLKVSQGSPFSSDVFEYASQIIDLMGPSVAVPASTPSKITAAFVNGLKNSLNSIE